MSAPEGTWLGRVTSLAWLVLLLIGAAYVMAHCSGCSGAALPVTTVPITVHCSWSITGVHGEAGEDETEAEQNRRASGGIVDSDCMVRDVSPSTSPRTTGNEVETGDITPSMSTSVTP